MAMVLVVDARSLAAQATVRLEPSSGGFALVNGFPRRVVAFVRDDGATSGGNARIVTLDAQSSVAMSAGAGVLVLEQFDLVAPTMALTPNWTPHCDRYEASTMLSSINALQSQLDALPIEQRREGVEALELAAGVAQLKNDRARALLNLKHNDPVSNYFMLDHFANATTTEQVARLRGQQLANQYDETVQEMTSMMKVYAEQAKAKYGVLAADAKRYKELVTSSEEQLSEVTAMVAKLDADVSRFATFNRTLAAELEQAAGGAAADPQIGAGIRRACTGPANVKDAVEIGVRPSDNTTVLVGEMTFDAGASQPMLLRRVRHTERWMGYFVWPPEASAASLRVRALNSSRWNNVPGSVRTDRDAFTSLASELRAQVASARKKYDETSNRAKGSDHVKTIIVP